MYFYWLLIVDYNFFGKDGVGWLTARGDSVQGDGIQGS